MYTNFLLMAAVAAVLLYARHRRHGAGKVPRSHTPTDWARAGLYTLLPTARGVASIARQLQRWAAAQHLPMTADTSLAPAGIVIGLEDAEFDAVSDCNGALTRALVESIQDAATSYERILVAEEPWVVIVPDPAARPGLPTLKASYNAEAIPPGRRLHPVPSPADRPVRQARGGRGEAGASAVVRHGRSDAPAAARTGSTSDPDLTTPPPRTTVGFTADIGGDVVATSAHQRSGRRASAAEEPTGLVRHVLRGDGRAFALAHDVVLGRGAECDIRVDNALVSRRHAVFYVVGPVLLVEDLASYNGTFVNDEKVTGPVELRSGDIVRLGPDGPTFTYRPIES